MAISTMDLQTRVTTVTRPKDDMDKRRFCANCKSTDHHLSASVTYKQGLKAIGVSREDEHASDIDLEDFINFGHKCFFCNLKGHFQPD